MSRKTDTDTAEDQASSEGSALEDSDLHGFWDRARLSGDENDEAFSIVVDEDDADRLSEAETLTYMGNVTQVDSAELVELAAWVESKACRYCRDKIGEHHNPTRLVHEDCRTALRVGRILRRYE